MRSTATVPMPTQNRLYDEVKGTTDRGPSDVHVRVENAGQYVDGQKDH